MSKVHFGLSNVLIAKRKVASDGTISYETPVKLPGAVSLNMTKNSNTSDFYADNIKYFTSAVKSGEDLELEVADITREFMLGYLGYVEAEGGGILGTNMINNDHFALLFQVETDEKARKFAYYNNTASESDEEAGTTEDQIDPKTQTIKMSNIGETVGDIQVFKQVVESTDANYATFFTSVAVPAQKASA